MLLALGLGTQRWVEQRPELLSALARGRRGLQQAALGEAEVAAAAADAAAERAERQRLSEARRGARSAASWVVDPAPPRRRRAGPSCARQLGPGSSRAAKSTNKYALD